MADRKIAIIPARGGSKRIPKKNIKDFLGKPVIAYSIEAAIRSDLFDEVMVSTDDEEVADIAVKCNAKVPFLRSKTNASDFATTVNVIEEVIREYAKIGKEFYYGCCLYATAPFVTPPQLRKGLEMMIVNQYDSVFPVIRFSFPIQRALRLGINSKMSMFQPEHLTARSQDLEPTYHDAGQYYWFAIASILRKQTLWTDNAGIFEIRESEAQDIDTTEDWILAECKYKLMQERSGTPKQ